MRLAVLAASAYAACRKLPELTGTSLDLDLLGQRLSEADAGFNVQAFRAERGLAEAVEQVVEEADERIESFLFFFSGYALLADERGPALLLDGERLGAFSLKRLKRLLAERTARALVVLDTVSAFDEPAAAALQTLCEALHEPGSPVHLIVSHRPDATGGERSPFTSLLELVLDWQSARNAPLGAEELYSALRAEESMFALLPATEYVPGSLPFDVLLGNRALGASIPPAPVVEEPAPEPVTLRPSAEERERALVASASAEERGDYSESLRELRVALHADARDVKALGRALVLFELCEQPDGRFNAACALELLGGANESELELAAVHRPAGLLPARGVLTESDWLAHRFEPELVEEDHALVKALGEAAVRLGLDTARRKRRVPLLAAATEQDAEKSTTMLARTLVWTARVLGLPRPRLHVLEGVPGELSIAPVADLTVLASKTLGSGLTLQELAFHWARCLVFLRPEFRLFSLFSAEGELDALARAALALTGSSATPRLDSDAKLFARALKRELRGPALDALAAAVGSRSASEVARRLKARARAATLVAARAGLLATGHLALAARLSERFPLPGSSATEQIDDLIWFSLGGEYRGLRERLGIAVGSGSTPE
jgi:hypothetical protein